MKQERSVVLFPAFDSLDLLADHYHRLRWYVPENSGVTVYLFHGPGLVVGDHSLGDMVPSYMADELGGDSHLRVLPWSWPGFVSKASGSASIALWRVESAGILDKISILTGKRLVVIDPSFRISCVRSSAFLLDHMPRADKLALRDESKSRLAVAALELSELGKAYVFGTGPSLSRAMEFDYSGGVRIVCNSIVRNLELLSHIRPHFITATDFVFHFGPSRYAAEFRRDLVSALEATGAYFLVTEQPAPLLFHHCPEIRERTIAIPLARRHDLRAVLRRVNVQLLDNFQVRSLNSVLTLLMLPVASTLADEVYVLGCDGRRLDDKGFWSHHGPAQYTGLMKTVSDCHPGFFAIDYPGYYEEYCRQVEAVCAAGEALGKSYASLAPSYVPALANRSNSTQMGR
jgi:hypothetical protein